MPFGQDIFKLFFVLESFMKVMAYSILLKQFFEDRSYQNIYSTEHYIFTNTSYDYFRACSFII